MKTQEQIPVSSPDQVGLSSSENRKESELLTPSPQSAMTRERGLTSPAVSQPTPELRTAPPFLPLNHNPTPNHNPTLRPSIFPQCLAAIESRTLELAQSASSNPYHLKALCSILIAAQNARTRERLAAIA